MSDTFSLEKVNTECMKFKTVVNKEQGSEEKERKLPIDYRCRSRGWNTRRLNKMMIATCCMRATHIPNTKTKKLKLLNLHGKFQRNYVNVSKS